MASIGMTRLSSDEYDLLLKFVGHLHSFRSRSSLCAWLLDEALPALIPSDWLSYNEVDLRSPANTTAILRPDSNRFQRLFPRFRELAHQHPIIVGQMQSPNFPVHKISDFLTQDAFHRLELYREVYRAMGVEYQIALTVRLCSSHVIAFALSRKQNDYEERDRAILELLRPHLVVAFNNLELLQSDKAVLDGNEMALSELSAATMIVNRQGAILYHTGPARDWLGPRVKEQLPAAVADWLYHCFATGIREKFRWSSAAGDLEMRLLPTRGGDRWLVVLSKAGHEASAASSAMAALSRRQQEVARWVREGKTNAEIAAIMSISPRTVQKHIEHIFEKWGVETRVAIATKLA